MSLGGKTTVLGKENERGRRNHSIIPGIGPIAGVVRNPGANVVPYAGPNFQGSNAL